MTGFYSKDFILEYVKGKYENNPPYFLKSWLSATACITAPAPKNNNPLFQQDIKKVIAYSTMSQLGMMVIAVGLSSYNIALFHLVNHAFYKALLFLGAGAVIHAVADNQDFRKYGGLKPFLPLTYSVMLIASLSLVAFPFMTGFYSKDFILESAYGPLGLVKKVKYKTLTEYKVVNIAPIVAIK